MRHEHGDGCDCLAKPPSGLGPPVEEMVFGIGVESGRGLVASQDQPRDQEGEDRGNALESNTSATWGRTRPEVLARGPAERHAGLWPGPSDG